MNIVSNCTLTDWKVGIKIDEFKDDVSGVNENY